jgi:hypothetical protein
MKRLIDEQTWIRGTIFEAGVTHSQPMMCDGMEKS